ncbi:ZN502 protein, partial [Leucopsar rothschildi]|nr:ZN502 protein [Leucopsar rothschildi]
SFSQGSHLIPHQEIQTKEHPCWCLECGKSFISKSVLVTCRRIHPGEQPGGAPYKCGECGKRVQSISDLMKHQWTHSGRPTLCREGGWRSCWSSCFLVQQQLHAKKKPCKCLECGMSFTISTTFITHQHLHTEERLCRPYECPECGKRFWTCLDLIKHQQMQR